MDDPTSPARIERLLEHREWVRRLSRSLVLDESRAADLEQEVWLSALERPPRDLRAPRGWLGTALRHAASNLRRGEGRRARREGAAGRPGAAPPAADLVAEAETQRRVVDAVLALEEPYRATVLLRWFDDLAPAEISSRTGVPVETVRTRLKRALERLRERLDREHRGERRAWVVALLPLANRAESPAAATTLAGGLLMTLKAKAAVAAAVVLLCLLGWFTLGGGEGKPEAPVPPPPPPPAPAPAVPKPPPPAPAPAPAPAPPPPPAAPAAGPGEVRGRVLAADGSPLEGALVFLGEQALARGDEPFKPFDPKRVPQAVRTDASGEFAVRGEGRVVTIWHPDASPVTVLVSACAEVRLPPRGAVRGRLVDGAGGPAAGVEVALDRTRKAVTDGDGRFAFDGVEAGVRGLLLPGKRYVAVRVAPGVPEPFEIGPGLPEVRVEIRAGGKPAAGPLRGILVGLDRVASQHEVKGADGACTIAGVLPGRFLLLTTGGHVARAEIREAAAAVELGAATLTVRAPAGTSLCLAPAEPDFLVDLFAMRVGHRPVPASGSLDFPGLADGDYRILVEFPAGSGRKAAEAPVSLRGGKDAAVDLPGK